MPASSSRSSTPASTPTMSTSRGRCCPAPTSWTVRPTGARTRSGTAPPSPRSSPGRSDDVGRRGRRATREDPAGTGTRQPEPVQRRRERGEGAAVGGRPRRERGEHVARRRAAFPCPRGRDRLRVPAQRRGRRLYRQPERHAVQPLRLGAAGRIDGRSRRTTGRRLVPGPRTRRGRGRRPRRRRGPADPVERHAHRPGHRAGRPRREHARRETGRVLAGAGHELRRPTGLRDRGADPRRAGRPWTRPT